MQTAVFKKYWFQSSLAASCLSLCLSFVQASCAASKASPASSTAKKIQHSLRMRQNQFQRGEQIVYICPKALKIINKTQDYKVVAKAPKWEVIAFRDDDKVQCRMSMSEFISHSGSRSGRLPESFKLVGERQMGPLKVKEYRQGADEVWLADESKIPQPVYDIFSAYNKCGRLSSIIVKVVSEEEAESVKWCTRQPGTKSVVMIETKQAEMVPYKESDYQIPTGYREVFSWEKFMVSSKSRDSAYEIFSEMGLGEKFGKRGK